MSKGKLKHKIIHLANGESVVVCTGVTLSDDRSTSKRMHDCGWLFIDPDTSLEPKRKQSKLLKEGSNKKSLSELKTHIESAGYTLPEAFGSIQPTNTQNITIKRREIYLRINTSTGQLGFSFQYQGNDPVSFHDAMDNAIALRDHLLDSRKERQQLLEKVNELEPLVSLLSNS